MNILLCGINFAPELTGVGKYTGEMAAWLAAQGHQVRVVTAPPYYPGWRVDSPYSASAWRHERWQGMQVWRCPLWVPRHPSGAKRLLHLASFALCSLPVMLRQLWWRPDVVWVVEPPLFCAPAALLVARLCGAKAWLHIQDFEVDAAFDLGLLKGAWLRRTVQAAERWLMRRFDVVSTISQRMHQRLLGKGVQPSETRLAPNWVDVAQMVRASVAGVAAYRQALDIPPGAVVALYSGNMGAKQGLELLADAARMQADWSATDTVAIVFVLCGGGAGRADLFARCQGLANVRFLDLQPTERLPDLLACADIHLLPQRADAADLVMPSKLTGMLASARPVVATAAPHTELASVLAGCGLVVPPADAAALLGAVRTLAADAALRHRLGQAGLEYAKAHLDQHAVLQRFEADLAALVARRHPTQ